MADIPPPSPPSSSLGLRSRVPWPGCRRPYAAPVRVIGSATTHVAARPGVINAAPGSAGSGRSRTLLLRRLLLSRSAICSVCSHSPSLLPPRCTLKRHRNVVFVEPAVGRRVRAACGSGGGAGLAGHRRVASLITRRLLARCRGAPEQDTSPRLLSTSWLSPCMADSAVGL